MISETTIAAIFSLLLLALFLWYWSTEKSWTRRWLGTALTGIVAGCALFTIFPNAWKGDFQTTNIAKGIDLGGGTRFVLRIDPGEDADGNAVALQPGAMDDIRATIESRLREKLDNRDKPITPVGDDLLEIQIPGLTEEKFAEVEEELTRPAILNLHLVDEAATQALAAGQPVPAGKMLRTLTPLGSDPENFTEEELESSAGASLVLPIQPSVEGTHVQSAAPGQLATGWAVNIRLDSQGGDKMLDTTRDNVGTRLAIMLDGVLISAPTIQARLASEFQITGDFTQQEASTLARALENPLRNEVVLEEVSQLSPSLGQAAIEQGMLSGLAALCATLVFLVLFYRFAGLIALFGLSVNLLILFGAVALAQQDLTLPGIAGVILTLGMAVDANVLIYERLKEELRDGKKLHAALKGAYDKAFSAIFDANITSLITAIVLFVFGSDALKGFAATLTAGILGTLFAALLVTRTGFRWMTDFDLLKKLSVGKLWKLTRFDFIGFSKLALVSSLLVFSAAVAVHLIKGKDQLSIDFLGGERLTYEIPQGSEADADLARQILQDAQLPSAPKIQEQTTPAGLSYLIINYAAPSEQGGDQTATIQRLLSEEHPGVQASLGAKMTPENISIGASFGQLMLMNSSKALAIGLVLIAFYIMVRFRVGFALGAIAALVHDLAIATAIMALLGFEINTIMVGAYLTIAGYSINDTIVVFDRIRETFADAETRRPNIRELINTAINSTLSRTLLTSGTTLLAVGILALFGGPDLRSFSLAILVGVLIGTWSSIFIASPIVYFFSRRAKGSFEDQIETQTAELVES